MPALVVYAQPEVWLTLLADPLHDPLLQLLKRAGHDGTAAPSEPYMILSESTSIPLVVEKLTCVSISVRKLRG